MDETFEIDDFDWGSPPRDEMEKRFRIFWDRRAFLHKREMEAMGVDTSNFLMIRPSFDDPEARRSFLEQLSPHESHDPYRPLFLPPPAV